jgi:hypothetical protein
MRDVSDIFNKFAGREVEMEARVVKVAGYTFTEWEPKNNPDPIISEMEKTADLNGLSLRVWWPGIGGTCDYRTDRVNAHIEREDDGKWRVQPRFDLG